MWRPSSYKNFKAYINYFNPNSEVFNRLKYNKSYIVTK